MARFGNHDSALRGRLPKERRNQNEKTNWQAGARIFYGRTGTESGTRQRKTTKSNRVGVGPLSSTLFI